jgi:hypothetical protein
MEKHLLFIQIAAKICIEILWNMEAGIITQNIGGYNELSEINIRNEK